MRNRSTRPPTIRPIDDGTRITSAFDVAISRSGRVRRVGPAADGETVLDAAVCYRLTALGFSRRAAAACLGKARGVFQTGDADTFRVVGGLDITHAYAVELTPTFDAGKRVSTVLMRIRDVTSAARQQRDVIAQERVAHACLVATVLHALRSSMNGIQLWSYVLEQQMDDASTNATTRRACDGIRCGIKQQVVLIERLHDAASAVIGDGPGRDIDAAQADATYVDAPAFALRRIPRRSPVSEPSTTCHGFSGSSTPERRPRRRRRRTSRRP